MRRPLVVLAVGSALCFAAAAGCAQPPFGPQICPRPKDPEPLELTMGMVRDGVFMTAPWDGEYVLFEGGAWFEVEHGLGCRPASIQAYLAFDRFPHGVVENSLIENESVALANGNQAEIKLVTDETFVILNGSCADYYLRVVASGCEPDFEGDGGAGGVGGAGGFEEGGAGGAGGM